MTLPAGTTAPPTLDHCVIHVTDWERSNAFYRDVLVAEIVPAGNGWVYRFGGLQLNVHGPGVEPHPVARVPVPPGGSDLCFVWPGPIAAAQAHLARHGVPVELGPVARPGARGVGQSVYFRDPDGSLLEFISYVDGRRHENAVRTSCHPDEGGISAERERSFGESRDSSLQEARNDTFCARR